MTRNTNKPFSNDYAIPPRRTLEESMAIRGMSQTELALRTGLSRKPNNGKASITTYGDPAGEDLSGAVILLE